MTLKKAFLGEWRITEAELWDGEDLDLVTPATLSLKPHGRGHIALIAIEAQLDYRVVTRDGLPAIEFSFHGFDEGDEVMGRGWAVLKGEELDGRLFFHRGDDSSFLAQRKPKASPAGSGLKTARKSAPMMEPRRRSGRNQR